MVVSGDGVDVWWDRRGEGPAILLVPGRGDASDVIPEELTSTLRSRGYMVIRWDPRDTGLSGDGGSSYTVATIAADAVAVLDAAGVRDAHVVGISMAGLVMLHLATRHSERVASLTFISAMSPDPGAGMGEDFFAALDSRDRVAELVGAMGETSQSDRAWAAEQVAAADRRAPHRPDAVARHQEAAFRLDWPTLEDQARVVAPALIVHGELDRILPLAHADALASGIKESSTMTVAGMGHLPRPADWATIADRVLEHLGADPIGHEPVVGEDS